MNISIGLDKTSSNICFLCPKCKAIMKISKVYPKNEIIKVLLECLECKYFMVLQIEE